MANAITFRGKITGDKKVQHAIGLAPERIGGDVRKQLWKERNKFLGGGTTKKGRGRGFRGRIEGLRLWGGRRNHWMMDTWSPQVVGLFNGFVSESVDKKSLRGIYLDIGILYNRKKDIHEALEFLQEGGRMGGSILIPFYENLLKISEIPRSLRMPKADRSSWSLMQSIYDIGLLDIIQDKGDTYYVYKEPDATGRKPILFMHTSSLKVKPMRKSRRIVPSFRRRIPSVRKRVAKAIDKSVRSIQRDMKKGKI
jgi:hypothetical protein